MSSAGLQDTSIRRILSEWFPTQANANHALRVNYTWISMYFFRFKHLNCVFIYNFFLQWLEWKQTWTCLQVLEVSGICIILWYCTSLHWCRCSQGHIFSIFRFFLLDNMPVTYIYLTLCQCSGLATAIIGEIYVLFVFLTAFVSPYNCIHS